MAPKWIAVSREALVGIVFVWIGISSLYGGSLPHFSIWTKWASLIVGVKSSFNCCKNGTLLNSTKANRAGFGE
jgi:hypothetical protein